MPSCRLVTDPNDPPPPPHTHTQARARGSGTVLLAGAAEGGGRVRTSVSSPLILALVVGGMPAEETVPHVQAKLWPHAATCTEGDLRLNGLSGRCSVSQNTRSEPWCLSGTTRCNANLSGVIWCNIYGRRGSK